MLHKKLSHSSGFSARLARAKAGDPSGGLSGSCMLMSAMLIHTFSSTEMAHRLLGRIKTGGENHHPLIPAFQFFLHVLTRAPLFYGPLSVCFHSQSALTSIYLHGPQHSRETGVSLMNYFPSSAARHQSAITISATSMSGWERSEVQRESVFCCLPKVKQPEKLRHSVCLARGSPVAALPVEHVGTSHTGKGSIRWML